MKERIWRLEFNEKQQCFHHERIDSVNHEPNTYGWITIAESISDTELTIFHCFIDSKCKRKLTEAFVKKSFSELVRFHNLLLEHKLNITK